MLRRTLKRFSIAECPPIADVTVHQTLTSSALLGFRNLRPITVQNATRVIKDTKDTVPAARLGRAIALLAGGDAAAAQKDAAAVQNAPGLKSTAASLNVMCLVSRLDGEAARASMSGAHNEAALNEISAALDNAILAISPNDWATRMQYAEVVATTSPEKAQKHFTAIENTLQVELNHRGAHGNAPQTGYPPATPITLSAVAARFPSQQHNAAVAGARAAVRKALGSDSLSEEDVNALVQIAAVEAAPVQAVTVFPFDAEYSDWTSAGAKEIAKKMSYVLGEHTTDIRGVEKLISEVPAPTKKGRFYGDIAELQKVLNEFDGKRDLLDTIENVCGESPHTPVSKKDAAFFAALSAIEAEFAELPALDHSTPALRTFYDNLIRTLYQQAKFRAQVGSAACAVAAGDFHGAYSSMTQVIESDRYVDMWKALAVRADALRKLGRVTDAEKDFEALHNLKLQPKGSDIPLLDMNRHKSAF